MKKNSMVIQQAKTIAKFQKEAKRNVAQIYACIAKALMEKYGWDADMIEELFLETQTLWNELVEHEEIDGMVAWCEQTTGISLATRD